MAVIIAKPPYNRNAVFLYYGPQPQIPNCYSCQVSPFRLSHQSEEGEVHFL